MTGDYLVACLLLLIGVLIIGFSVGFYLLILIRVNREVKPHAMIFFVIFGAAICITVVFALFRGVPKSYAEAKERLSDPQFNRYFRKAHTSYVNKAPDSSPLDAPEFLPKENLWPLYQQMISEDIDEKTKETLVTELKKKSRFHLESEGFHSTKSVELIPAPGELALICIRWLSPTETKTEYRIENKSTFAPITFHYGQVLRSKERVLFGPAGRGKKFYQPILGHEPVKSWPIPIGESIGIPAEEVEPKQDCLFYVTYRTGPEEQMKYAQFVVSSFRTELEQGFRISVLGPRVLLPIALGMALIYLMFLSKGAQRLYQNVPKFSDASEPSGEGVTPEAVKGELVVNKYTGQGELMKPGDSASPSVFDKERIKKDLEKIKESKSKLATYFATAKSTYTLRAQQEYLESLARAFGVETDLIRKETEKYDALKERELKVRDLHSLDKDIQISEKKKDVELAKLKTEEVKQATEQVKHLIEAKKVELELEQMKSPPSERKEEKEEKTDKHAEMVEELKKKVETSASYMEQMQTFRKEWAEKYGDAEAQAMYDDFRTTTFDDIRRMMDQ